MSRTVPAHRKRNARWPLKAGAKGWERVSLESRYDSALRHLGRTLRGTYPWEPFYGLSVPERSRTQIYRPGDEQAYADEFELVAGRWIPDVSILGIDILPPKSGSRIDRQTLTLVITWDMSPGQTRNFTGKLSEPRVTTVTV